jgi:hypothetical protein
MISTYIWAIQVQVICCNSVTAEINPHFRPAEYRRFHYKRKCGAVKDTTGET